MHIPPYTVHTFLILWLLVVVLVHLVQELGTSGHELLGREMAHGLVLHLSSAHHQSLILGRWGEEREREGGGGGGGDGERTNEYIGEGKSDGGRKEGREIERDGEREGGKEGGKEGEREGEGEGGRERGRERGRVEGEAVWPVGVYLEGILLELHGGRVGEGLR